MNAKKRKPNLSEQKTLPRKRQAKAETVAQAITTSKSQPDQHLCSVIPEITEQFDQFLLRSNADTIQPQQDNILELVRKGESQEALCRTPTAPSGEQLAQQCSNQTQNFQDLEDNSLQHNIIDQLEKANPSDWSQQNDQEYLDYIYQLPQDEEQKALENYDKSCQEIDYSQQSFQQVIDSQIAVPETQDKQEEEVEGESKLLESIPPFLEEGKVQDAQGRTQADPLYDPRTLYVPQDYYNKCSPYLKQYLTFKREHFDMVLFMARGRFYDSLLLDAVTVHQKLDYPYQMRKMKIGIPDHQFLRAVLKLTLLNCTVAVATQEEMESEHKQRVKELKPAKNARFDIQRAVLRKITKIPPGIFSDPLCLLAIVVTPCKGREGAGSALHLELAVLESQSCRIVLADFDDEQMLIRLCSFVSSHRSQTVLLNVVQECAAQKQHVLCTLQSQLGHFALLQNQYQNITSAKELIFAHLKRLLLADTVKQLAVQARYDEKNNTTETLEDEVFQVQKLAGIRAPTVEGTSRQRLILDSSAVRHLEIFDLEHSPQGETQFRTLFQCVNTTLTGDGQRTLKNWMLAPLCAQGDILERQKCLQDLETLGIARLQFRAVIKQLKDNDLQRACQRIYHYALQECEGITAYEDVSKVRLRELKNFFANALRICDAVNTSFSSYRQQFTSDFFKNLVEIDESKNFLHFLQNAIEIQFMSRIVWRGKSGNDPTPKNGVSIEFDMQSEQLHAIQQTLSDYLEEVRAHFDGDTRIQYFHSKIEYQIEIPQELFVREKQQQKKPSDFVLTSQKRGYDRFHSPKLLLLLKQLESARDLLRRHIATFAKELFHQFLSQRALWEQFVHLCGELDALLAMHEFSYCDPPTSFNIALPQFAKPVFVKEENGQFNAATTLHLATAVHPCLALALAQHQQVAVPNDLNFGLHLPSRCKLISGPNMGGKSSLLRTAGVAVVLAQMGCHVPCAQLIFGGAPVDRIFSRMGSPDSLFLRKSTFFLEMEEALRVTRYATARSLVLIDELGRGTDSREGEALASAILQYVTEGKNGPPPLLLSATHSLEVVTCLQDRCELLRMDFIEMYDDDCDAPPEDQQQLLLTTPPQVIFIYKAVPGVNERSLATNVMRTLKIPDEIILEAEYRSALHFAGLL